ncbi:hypothetical protein ACFQVC_21430 [Streptomyces monticola]|uniref:Type IV secretion system protein n=1 Tax=Streptomyces monticola TaxID=2666263 RepID=A0ABW2JKX8_9ACTN
MIVNGITAFLGMLIEQAMKPLREVLADTLLSTPDVTRQGDIKRLWAGSLAMAAGIYVLFVTVGGVTVMGYETVQTRYAVKQIAPRLLIGIIAASMSLTVMGKAISVANALSHAVLGTDMSDAGKGLVERVVPFALGGVAGLKLYLLLIAVVTIIMILAVVIGFIVRVALIAVLAVAAPVALSCHAHPATDPVARLWWRGLAGCLTIQVAQSMTFIVALKLFFAPGATLLGFPKPNQLGTMLAGLALFWVLFKIPGWCMRVVFRATPVSPQMPMPVRIVQTIAMWRLLGRAMPGLFGPGRRPGGGGGFGGGGGPRGGGGGGHGGGGGPGAGVGRGPLPALGGPAGFLLRGGRALAEGVRGRRSAAPTTPRRPPRANGPAARRTAAEPTSKPAPLPSPTPSSSPTASSRAAAPAHRTAPTSTKRGPENPRSVVHPSQARITRQLELPIPVSRVPGRPSGSGPGPGQGRQPARETRRPSVPRPIAPPPPSTLPPSSSPARQTDATSRSTPQSQPKPRSPGRQLALPIPAPRVRVRPARPMQLRLPLERPRS